MKVSRKDMLFVGTQFSLFFLYLFDLPVEISLPITVNIVGRILAIAGGAIVLVALLQLNKSLSPFPTPKSDGELRTNGLYAIVRHPIYSGIILTTLGYGLYVGSLWKLAIAIVLVILFHYKAKYEEALLSEKFEHYTDYKKKTGRLVPKLT